MLAAISYRDIEVQEAGALTAAPEANEGSGVSPNQVPDDLYFPCDPSSVEYMLPAHYCFGGSVADIDAVGVDVVYQQQQACWQQLQLSFEQQQSWSLGQQQQQQGQQVQGRHMQGMVEKSSGRLAVGSRVPGWAPYETPYEVGALCLLHRLLIAYIVKVGIDSQPVAQAYRLISLYLQPD